MPHQLLLFIVIVIYPYFAQKSLALSLSLPTVYFSYFTSLYLLSASFPFPFRQIKSFLLTVPLLGSPHRIHALRRSERQRAHVDEARKVRPVCFARAASFIDCFYSHYQFPSLLVSHSIFLFKFNGNCVMPFRSRCFSLPFIYGHNWHLLLILVFILSPPSSPQPVQCQVHPSHRGVRTCHSHQPSARQRSTEAPPAAVSGRQCQHQPQTAEPGSAECVICIRRVLYMTWT